MAEANGFKLGQVAPPLELPDTEGKTHELEEGAPATVVVWTCNHCPYALAWHDRIVATANDYAGQGVRFLAVNSNDAERYPDDSLGKMAERVAAGEFPFPYLHDESQQAARAWGAQKTPHVFVLDPELRLRYTGAPDADYEDPSEDAAWLRVAIEDVLEGNALDNPETEPVGCSIKWKQ